MHLLSSFFRFYQTLFIGTNCSIHYIEVQVLFKTGTCERDVLGTWRLKHYVLGYATIPRNMQRSSYIKITMGPFWTVPENGLSQGDSGCKNERLNDHFFYFLLIKRERSVLLIVRKLCTLCRFFSQQPVECDMTLLQNDSILFS